MRNGAVVLKTIAENLGVSTTSVHRALADKPGVGPELRRRVLRTAAELGYRPNLVARSLATNRSTILGVVVISFERGAWYGQLVEGIEREASEYGYSLLLGCSHDDPARERLLVRTFLDKGVDGLLILPTDTNPRANLAFYQELLARLAPLVFVDAKMPGLSADLVGTDEFKGGYLAGRHLVEQGRRQVAFFRPLPDYPGMAERQAGCATALREAQLPGPLLVEAPVGETHFRTWEATARGAFADFLTAAPPLDGLFAGNDVLAYGALAALRDARLCVPDQVAVVGFDDLGRSAHVSPPLTTVRQEMEAEGAAAVRSLLRRLEGSEDPSRQVLVEPTLVVRQSCGPVCGS
jgi:LacI family transcriptional regulator